MADGERETGHTRLELMDQKEDGKGKGAEKQNNRLWRTKVFESQEPRGLRNRYRIGFSWLQYTQLTICIICNIEMATNTRISRLVISKIGRFLQTYYLT